MEVPMKVTNSSFLTLQCLLMGILSLIAVLPISESQAQNADELEVVKKLSALPWIKGPSEGAISGVATVKLASDLQFLGTSATNQFLQLFGNLPNENSYTLAKADLLWFSVFQFERSGYVKDDETIDPDILLKQLKENNEAGNEERKKRGLQLIHLEGWFTPPHYDKQTNRLEWGTRLRRESGDEVVNYTTRLLGKGGVMSATLVSDPNNLEHDVVEFKSALKAFAFNPGETYAEYKQGDKVAEYGLAALVVGGAAAAAAKSGAGKAIFKGLGILILAGLAAIGAFLKKIFGEKK